jgi:DNA polymerase-3 subunit delta
MFYVFHGPDEFSQAEQIAEFQARMGDQAMASLNTIRLDGRKITLGELRHACDAIPFMAARRLVIVDGLLTRLGGRRRRGAGEGEEGIEPSAGRQDTELAQLLEYLPGMPETTRLIFVEDELLDKKHPILALAKQQGSGYVKDFVPPTRGTLSQWISRRAEAKGGRIVPRAAEALTAYVGQDLRLLDQELEKLLTYVGSERPVKEEDVHLLTPYVREANIFEMVDAIGLGNGQRALSLLHKLLEENKAPLYLLSMIVRQFRILLQVKDLLGRNVAPGAIPHELDLHPYVAEKAVAQARSFSLERLECIYRRLLETDLAIKTGQMEDLLALDTLIVDLCGE